MREARKARGQHDTRTNETKSSWKRNGRGEEKFSRYEEVYKKSDVTGGSLFADVYSSGPSGLAGGPGRSRKVLRKLETSKTGANGRKRKSVRCTLETARLLNSNSYKSIVVLV